MATQIQDPKISIKDLIDNNWDTSNTSISSKPTITTGWWDNSNENPMVTISGAEESPIGGGTTGFSGIEPTKELEGSLQVDCWSDRNATTVNPKKLTFEFSDEVKRIIDENHDQATDLRYVTFLGRQERPDASETPTLYRYICTVGYDYFSFS